MRERRWMPRLRGHDNNYCLRRSLFCHRPRRRATQSFFSLLPRERYCGISGKASRRRNRAQIDALLIHSVEDDNETDPELTVGADGLRRHYGNARNADRSLGWSGDACPIAPSRQHIFKFQLEYFIEFKCARIVLRAHAPMVGGFHQRPPPQYCARLNADRTIRTESRSSTRSPVG
jgi:hypothetical protein